MLVTLFKSNGISRLELDSGILVRPSFDEDNFGIDFDDTGIFIRIFCRWASIYQHKNDILLEDNWTYKMGQRYYMPKPFPILDLSDCVILRYARLLSINKFKWQNRDVIMARLVNKPLHIALKYTNCKNEILLHSQKCIGILEDRDAELAGPDYKRCNSRLLIESSFDIKTIDENTKKNRNKIDGVNKMFKRDYLLGGSIDNKKKQQQCFIHG